MSATLAIHRVVGISLREPQKLPDLIDGRGVRVSCWTMTIDVEDRDGNLHDITFFSEEKIPWPKPEGEGG